MMKKTSVIQDKLVMLPSKPGIYQFKDKGGKIIYVGKAKNLRNRVRSYFVSKHAAPLTAKMISLISDVEIMTTDSEVESLILEMNLIKQLKPRYNVNLKDDKSFPYIVITNEPFPRVFPTRRRRNDGSRYIGPFTDVGNMKYSLKMLRDIFMIRTCSLNITDEAVRNKKFKICLEHHIKKCEGPCEGLVTRERYNLMINEVEKLLNGKTETLIKELKAKMEEASKQEDFEEAALLRNKIDSLEVYSTKQKVVSEDFLDKDIINMVKEGDDACAMILNIREGKVLGKRHYYLDSVEDKSNSEIFENVIYRYYSENNFIPNEIHLHEEIEDAPALKQWFEKTFSKKVELIFPKRGEKVQLLSMVRANAQYMLDELKLQRLKREFIPHSVTALKRDLNLNKLPRRIECYDISHIQGTDTVASMTVFIDGKPKKSDYRKFKLQTVLNEVGKPDDFLSMREVIYRRFRKLTSPPASLLKGEGRDNLRLQPSLSSKQRETEGEVIKSEETFDKSFSSTPDLIVIDGGKGQLSSAVEVLSDLGLKNYNIIGLAKRLEEVFLPEFNEAQNIPKTSSGLKLLQRIRDEAHRFAITFHRSLRDKRTLKSEIEDIKGIGKKTAEKLLKEFGSVEKIKEMIKNNFEELEKKAGKKTAVALREHLTI
jgi:excinuclease ABC subunit C